MRMGGISIDADEFSRLLESSTQSMESIICSGENALETIVLAYQRARNYGRIPSAFSLGEEYSSLSTLTDRFSEIHWHLEVGLHSVRCAAEHSVLATYAELDNDSLQKTDEVIEQLDALQNLCREYRRRLDAIINSYELKISDDLLPPSGREEGN
jgi:DNA repair ATPase RecN